MERKDLESAAAQVTYLRGLLAVPLGLLFIATGLGNLGWGPFAESWVFIVALALIGGAYLGISRYYNDNYGRATPSRPNQWGYGVASFLLFAAGLVGGTILDHTFDVPVSAFAISFALAMLAWFAICVGLRAHHLVIWGALLVVGLVPVWGSLADKISVGWLPIGVATIVAGLFDHRALVESFGPGRDLSLETSSAGA